jgi:integrase
VEALPSITLRERLKLPVETIKVDGLPKLIAGGLPVTPLNIVLKWKRDNRGATDSSLETYARAGRLYTEFAAHRGKPLLDITDEEFRWFTRALKGGHFPDENNDEQHLSGARGPRTSELMLALLYSLAADFKDIYKVEFAWYRYSGVPNDLVEVVRVLGGPARSKLFRRAHRVPYIPRKVMPLPDEEFKRLIEAAYERWGHNIADGDMAFAEDPESQRGALFYRNMALLLSLRFEGARRSEVPCITLNDIDRKNSQIHLVTKGHGGPNGERLPVLLHPLVENAIWRYVAEYRPNTDENSVEGYPIFLSHSTRNYGKPISAQCVRKVIDALRDKLRPPWRELVSPHTLRHSFAVDLQKCASEAATTINMRHASSKSLKSYRATPEIFAAELLASGETRLSDLLLKFGIKN